MALVGSGIMRRLFAIASPFLLAIASAWAAACESDAPSPGDGGVDAADVATDTGDGTCSVDTRFDEPVLVDGLSRAPIESAHLRDDERRIVVAFVDGADDAGVVHTLYEADRSSTDAAFENVRPLTELNSVGESWPTLTPDFLTIYFHSTREGRERPGRIDRATRKSEGDPFGDPAAIATLDIETHRATPHLARHAAEIWFSAADKSLAYRIFVAKLKPDGLTETPTIVRELSVSGLDSSHPVLSADGLTIYWRASSLDASAGSGTGDIWVGTRSSPDGPFEALRPVDELKSPALDQPAWLTADRCRLYFVSERGSRRELYVATRAP
jgi:hypothetical protein